VRAQRGKDRELYKDFPRQMFQRHLIPRKKLASVIRKSKITGEQVRPSGKLGLSDGVRVQGGGGGGPTSIGAC